MLPSLVSRKPAAFNRPTTASAMLHRYCTAKFNVPGIAPAGWACASPGAFASLCDAALSVAIDARFEREENSGAARISGYDPFAIPPHSVYPPFSCVRWRCLRSQYVSVCSAHLYADRAHFLGKRMEWRLVYEPTRSFGRNRRKTSRHWAF